jgi:hypothetical protein
VRRIRQDERRLIALVVGDREQQDLVEGNVSALARERAGLAEQLRTAAAEGRREHHGPHRAAVRSGATRPGPARRQGWQALVEEIIDEILVLLDRSVRIHGLLGPSRTEPGVEESV